MTIATPQAPSTSESPHVAYLIDENDSHVQTRPISNRRNPNRQGKIREAVQGSAVDGAARLSGQVDLRWAERQPSPLVALAIKVSLGPITHALREDRIEDHPLFARELDFVVGRVEGLQVTAHNVIGEGCTCHLPRSRVGRIDLACGVPGRARRASPHVRRA